MKKAVLYPAVIAMAIGCSGGEQVIHPQTKLLTAAVYASGTLVPEHEYRVTGMLDGYIQQAYVEEGDSIHTGEILFVINNAVKQAQQVAAGEMVAVTAPVAADNAPQLRDMRNRVEAARLKMRHDSMQYIRYKNLYEQKAVSRSAYERYELMYETTAKELSALRQQLQNVQLAGDIQLQQARTQLTLSKADAYNSRVSSRLNGVVYEVYKKQGDYININQPIALVGSRNMVARLLVDEDDFAKLSIGQKVLITMDAYPGKTFTGSIRKIYPSLSRADQSFRVDAIINGLEGANLYGLNLEANIIVSENKKVLAVPRASLLKGDSVLVDSNGERKMVKIAKGIEDNDWVEVKHGVDLSSTIIIKR